MHGALEWTLTLAAAGGLAWSHPASAQEPAAVRPFAAGEALFRRDPRWLGADAALSVPLDGERTLWLFGDTFVATSEARRRAGSRMVRNTVALQTGLEPSRAAIEFGWGRAQDGAPASFFPDRAEAWYWPGHGVRLERSLVLFLFEVAATPGQGLGFDTTGWALARIDDPRAPLAAWKPVIDRAPAPAFDALPATAVVLDGEHVVALAIRQHGLHAGALVRWPSAALAAGELGGAEWWNGARWASAAELGPVGPAFVLDDAGAECSLHRDPASGRFVHVASYGFGATTIGLRTAPALTGPWSAPTTVYRPPESDAARPFVYAAKAHPELEGGGALLVTYAANSFEFGDLFTDEGERGLYWPRFVAVPAELVK